MDTRPENHLMAAGRLYPQGWRLVEKVQADRGKDGLSEWPAWYYLPVARWYPGVSAHAQKGKLPIEEVSWL